MLQIFSVILKYWSSSFKCLEEFADELFWAWSFFVKSISFKDMVFLQDIAFHEISSF